MPKFAGHRNVAVTMSALSPLFWASCVALVSACSSPQHAATTTGTTPAIWTGASAPKATSGQETAPARAGAPNTTAHLKAPDGTEVATAKFEFSNGFATITIATTGGGHLSPGFHGVHIHKVGKCEPNSLAPGSTGAPGDFLSAGGHFQVPGHAGHSSGDLTSLQVRKDGSGMLVTTTDAFTMEDLTTGEKTAIIIHAGADNFANIPADRYNQVAGPAGPDETTMTTGDAGKRVACGVIGSG
jgi:Cu-Zn family superoxide dismutase